MTRGLLWSTPGRPERTIAFAAIGTGQVIGLVGAHNLPGLDGATADGGSWLVSGPMRADAGMKTGTSHSGPARTSRRALRSRGRGPQISVS